MDLYLHLDMTQLATADDEHDAKFAAASDVAGTSDPRRDTESDAHEEPQRLERCVRAARLAAQ